MSAPRPPARILVGYQSLSQLGTYIASRRPDLEVRARKVAEITKADLDWAEAFVGFRRPPANGTGNVRWVHCVGAGVDAFLFGDPLPDHVLLTRTSEHFGPQIAEYCVSRALAWSQRILELADEQRARRWTPRHPDTLRGNRVVIVGTGEVGAAIARAFDALGCDVHGVSRGGAARPPFHSVSTTSALGDMVGEARWLILAIPLTAETVRLVSRDVLARCNGAFLINVGRGALVEEEALPDALDAGWLRGAALDVFATEPLPPDSPLWARRDVLISPHVAGLTTVEGAAEGFLECLAQLERGERPRMTVDRIRGY
jgi:phosphoglycerate dehydrogenase-like enzyme